jgi:hypothetical protein
VGRSRDAHAFPPDRLVVAQGDIGEDGVALVLNSAFGFDFMLVPGATPKKPASGLIA